MGDADNFHVVLRSRPGESNEPLESNFSYEKKAYPTETLSSGDLLIKNRFLSLDPALRCRMNEDSGVQYIKAWELGKTVDGLGGVGEVIASADSSFQPGDIVTPNFEWPWELYFVVKANTVRKLPEAMTQISPTLCLSVLGVTGLTAYLGVKEKGHIRRDANQVMVVSAAAGSTGSLAGQIGKAEGCGKLVGICGSDTKCQWLTTELGFDVAINYKTENVSEKLEAVCPEGVDVYFDNVGGSISNDVIRKMNQDSHIILCGQIADYNKDLPYPPPIPTDIEATLKDKNITRERFLVLNYQDQFEPALGRLMELYVQGKLKVKETIEMGLENAGKAFVSMMKGGNIGKQIVQVTR
ncbi:prostaglandin reductase 2 [Aplysia californica]|uniref:15-oxoprostaglandin 13-reductase n=1 Tax=Aplysia californica TaxID=6500 RepID=A0ABM0JUE7_APLCA|nr:prostaglandin reductase 2 [Aplysia californica]